MGQCQMKNCRCICKKSRISCQCGSANTLILEEEARELRRRNEGNQMRRSNRFVANKKTSPRKSNSRDSSDSLDKTKHSTNRRQTSKSPGSSERYLLSNECNLPSEPNYTKKQTIIIRQMSFRFKNSYFITEQVNSDFLNFIKSQEESSKKDSPHFFGRRDVSEQLIPQFKEQPVKSSTLADYSFPTDKKTISNQSSDQLNPQISIAAYTYTEKNSKISKPITYTSVDVQPASDNKIKASLTVTQQQQQRSKTADLSDDQKSLMTPTRSVLKHTQKSNDSFRTQQIEKKRKVRFDLPHSHYVRERARQQQQFFC